MERSGNLFRLVDDLQDPRRVWQSFLLILLCIRSVCDVDRNGFNWKFSDLQCLARNVDRVLAISVEIRKLFIRCLLLVLNIIFLLKWQLLLRLHLVRGGLCVLAIYSCLLHHNFALLGGQLLFLDWELVADGHGSLVDSTDGLGLREVGPVRRLLTFGGIAITVLLGSVVRVCTLADTDPSE